ncbi:hypothetical protein GQX74_011054 [Glossina fuscipes]|nr:hypothetical protein GQX74_011054 [Glossina fuscipes]
MEAIRRPTQLRGPKPKGRNTNGLLGFKALTFSFVCSDRSQRSAKHNSKPLHKHQWIRKSNTSQNTPSTVQPVDDAIVKDAAALSTLSGSPVTHQIPFRKKEKINTVINMLLNVLLLEDELDVRLNGEF